MRIGKAAVSRLLLLLLLIACRRDSVSPICRGGGRDSAILTQTALQAMAAVVPPVASRVGGVPELIEDGSGTLLPPDDPVARSEGLAEVLENADRASAMSERARRRTRAYSGSTTD